MDQLLAMRAFARVVEVGSFTKASDSLELSKSTVSRMLDELEEHLRVKLLSRTTRKVTVTPDGRLYYEHVSRMLNDLAEIDGSFGQERLAPRGHIRVEMNSSLASAVVIPALSSFYTRYPEITLDLRVRDWTADLISENLDCVIRGGSIRNELMVARFVGKTQWVTCASPEYLRQFGEPAHPRDFVDGHRLVRYVSPHTGREIAARFEKNGLEFSVEGKGLTLVNESNAHLIAGLNGLGVIHSFDYMVQRHLDSGQLVQVLADWQPQPYPINVLYSQNRYLSMRVRIFIDWVVETFALILQG